MSIFYKLNHDLVNFLDSYNYKIFGFKSDSLDYESFTVFNIAQTAISASYAAKYGPPASKKNFGRFCIVYFALNSLRRFQYFKLLDIGMKALELPLVLFGSISELNECRKLNKLDKNKAIKAAFLNIAMLFITLDNIINPHYVAIDSLFPQKEYADYVFEYNHTSVCKDKTALKLPPSEIVDSGTIQILENRL